jgi:fibrillarin-like pre-rRNA processing protein
MKMQKTLPGVWRSGKKIFTENLVPGEKVFTKNLVRIKGTEYREWDPHRSKPAAAITKGLRDFPIKRNSKILYLGISSGTTSTFFSDVIGKNGIIYGVEISERSIRDLNPVAEKRGNIVPILADSRKPETYSWIEPVDVVYQDVATNDQSEILIRNCKAFLRKDGFAILAIKSRSIDVTKPPKEIYKQEEEKLKKVFKILERKELDPYEKDHLFLVMKWK